MYTAIWKIKTGYWMTYSRGAVRSGGHVELVAGPHGVVQAWVGERTLLSAGWGRWGHLLQFDGVGRACGAAVPWISGGRHTDVRGGAHCGHRCSGTTRLQPTKENTSMETPDIYWLHLKVSNTRCKLVYKTNLPIWDMEQKDKGDVKWKYSTYCSALKKDIKL